MLLELFFFRKNWADHVPISTILLFITILNAGQASHSIPHTYAKARFLSRSATVAKYGDRVAFAIISATLLSMCCRYCSQFFKGQCGRSLAGPCTLPALHTQVGNTEWSKCLPGCEEDKHSVHSYYQNKTTVASGIGDNVKGPAITDPFYFPPRELSV